MTRARGQEGFTLVELLVTMMLLIIVLGATLTAFEVFGRQAAANTQRGVAQDAARNALGGLARSIRNQVTGSTAAGLEVATSTDLVFQTIDSANPPSGTNASDRMRVRYCLDASNTSNQRLYLQTQRWTTATAPTSPTGACGSTTGSPAWDTSSLVADHIVNPVQGSTPIVFTYGPSGWSTLGDIATVGVNLQVDMDPTRSPGSDAISTTIGLRNIDRPPAVTLDCLALGAGAVSCDSFGTTDPDGQTMAYAWTYGLTCSSRSTIAGQTSPQLYKSGLTAGTQYCFGLTATDPGGVSSTATKVVTAR
jgi:type II secretory pathway pseudopilin PulG